MALRTLSRPKMDTSWLEINIDEPDVLPDKEAVLIPRESIEAGSLNARQHFPPETLRELGESMREHGQLQPILVRLHPRKEGKYEIVAGERRWRAAGEKCADLPTLRCRVGEYTDVEVRIISLAENLTRDNLTPLEVAHQLINIKESNVAARLHWDDVARMVGRSRQWVDRYVALADAPAPVQEAVSEGRLTPAHARAIRQLEPPQQVRLARVAAREQLTTRQLEDRVRELKAAEIPPKFRRSSWCPKHYPPPPAADLQTALFHVERAAREMGKLHKPQEYYHKELRKQVAALRARLDEIERVGIGELSEAAA